MVYHKNPQVKICIHTNKLTQMYQNVLSISPNKIVEYWKYEGASNHKKINNISLTNLKDNNTHGNISKNARKRLLSAVDWLCAYACDKWVFEKKTNKKFRYKVGFVTLTLSSKQKHSDKEIKDKLLNQFLTEAKWRWGVVHYVWRAEAQKNGNIHFHILTDKFIQYGQLRDVWNRIQNKLGYVNEFKEKYGHSNPNSTDIHSVVKIKNIRRYVAKYMSKQDDSRKITGNIWGLSYSISQSKPLTISLHGNFEDAWEDIKKIGNSFVKVLDYCTAFYYELSELIEGCENEIIVNFADFLSYQRSMWETGQLKLSSI